MTYNQDIIDIVSQAVPDVIVYDRWEKFVEEQKPRAYLEFLSSSPQGLKLRDNWRAHFIPAVPHAARLLWALGHPYYQDVIRGKGFNRMTPLRSGATIVPQQYAYGVVDRAVVPFQLQYEYDFRVDAGQFTSVKMTISSDQDSKTFIIGATSLYPPVFMAIDDDTLLEADDTNIIRSEP